MTGNVSYDPDNHHHMQILRAAKVEGIADDIGPLEVFGPDQRRPSHPRLGLDLRRHPLCRRNAFTQTASRSPTLTCVISTRSRRTPRRSFEAIGGC